MINRLQKILKTDVRYLAQGAAHLLTGQAVASVFGFLLTIVLTHTLEPTRYGLYAYIFSISGIVVAFTLSGIDTSVAQSVAKGHERTVIDGFWIKLTWSTPVGLITSLAGLYYLFYENTTLGYALVVMGVSIPIIYACSLYGAYFNGKKQFKRIAYDNAFKNSIGAIAMMLTAYMWQSVLGVVIAFFGTNLIISVIRYGLLTRQIRIQTHTTETTSLTYGKHLSIMDAFSVISAHIDKIIVFQFLGATALGVYALALAPIKQLQGVSKLIRTLALPRYSTRTATEIIEGMQHKFRILMFTSVVTIALYWLSAPYIFAHFFPKYHDALFPSQVLALSLIFTPFILHTQALTALEKTRSLYWLHGTKPFIRITLLILLVPQYGLWGAVWSLLLF